MKVLQINTIVNSGSHGRIAEDIGKLLITKGHESSIAFGRGRGESVSKLIRIGSSASIYLHVLRTRLLDGHGFGSYGGTEKFLEAVESIDPDVIHLHNIHGYYINIELLFKRLQKLNKPVVWTMHDCWAFTGHCSYFDHVNCEKWKTHCQSCPNIKGYPGSWLMDRSKNNYRRKRELFTGLESLTVVAPSKWLADLLHESYLKHQNIQVIHNGIDLRVFNPDMDPLELRRKYKLEDKAVILGVANIWDKRKGLKDFLELNASLHPNEKLVLVGLNKTQLKALPESIVGVERTESVEELARFYAMAEVYVNPTYLDNFPTTNLEALACGTPVITYQTGGSPEAIDGATGIVLPKGDIRGIRDAIDKLAEKDRDALRNLCRERANRMFNKNDRFTDYIALYRKLLDLD